MSAQARDVVRYIKAIEETGGERTIWHQSPSGGFYCLPETTPDGFRARTPGIFSFEANVEANLAAAAAYLKARYGSDTNPAAT